MLSIQKIYAFVRKLRMLRILRTNANVATVAFVATKVISHERLMVGRNCMVSSACGAFRLRESGDGISGNMSANVYPLEDVNANAIR